MSAIASVMLSDNLAWRREKVLYWTAQLRGVPTRNGLRMLDGGKDITIPERVDALRTCYVSKSEPQRLSSKAVAAATDLYHARLVLTAEFGQQALRDLHPLQYSASDPAVYPLSSLLAPPETPGGVLASLRVLIMPDRQLRMIDVRGMEQLELLDLRNNNLQDIGIVGLGGLSNLRLLNVVGNPKLDVSALVSSMLGPKAKHSKDEFGLAYPEPLHNLESLYFGLPGRKVCLLEACDCLLRLNVELALCVVCRPPPQLVFGQLGGMIVAFLLFSCPTALLWKRL